MAINVFLALIGWPVIVLGIFAMMPAVRAAAVGVIGAWLFLPPSSLPLAGLPDYTKNTAAVVGIILGTFVFCPDRLITFRPRWFDLPMLLYCVSGIVTSQLNGLGLYDGLSDAVGQTITWGLPYLLGRLYFGNFDAMRILATAMVVGTLCYLPLAHFEIRFMTSLLKNIYAVGRWGSGTGLRMGGYRPNVFFSTGLELGLWMTAGSLAGWWLWRCGVLKRFGPISFGAVLLPIMFVTAIFCRSTGALVLLAGGMLTLLLSARIQTRLFLFALLLVPPLYVACRTTKLWTGESAVNLSEVFFGSERAGSLEFRFNCERLLMSKALQQPIFGWGGWNRSAAYYDIKTGDETEEGKKRATKVITDGLWIVLFGKSGFVGLSLFYLSLALPAHRFVFRFAPKLWADPRVAASSLAAALVGLYMIDCLLNGFVNIVYVTLAGGLAGLEPKQLRSNAVRIAVGTAAGAGKIVRADHDYNRGRTLKAEGRLEESLAFWRHALNLLSEAMTTDHESLDLKRRWCDCANDLAWLLANAPDPAIQNAAEGVALALKATDKSPACATYWNTLGAAYYRAGNFQAAVTALDHAIALNHVGTAFDHVFLAMAHGRLGNLEAGRHWFTLAKNGMERSWPGHVELHRFCDEAEATLLAIESTTR